MTDFDAAIAAITADIRRDGFSIERDGDTLSVGSADGVLAFRPVVRLPPDLLHEYLQQPTGLRSTLTPEEEALSLLGINIVEELGTDHGEGRNYTRAVDLRRGRDGRVGLFVDQDVPPVPHRPPDPDLQWTAERPDEG